MAYWQQVLASGFSEPAALLEYLKIKPEQVPLSFAAHQQFKTLVPLGFAEKMQAAEPNCPLLRQVLPVMNEIEPSTGYSHDPLQEQGSNPLPGVLHKYQGRILVTLAGSCAINCRYCFRRHFPYQDNQISPSQWQQIIDYLQSELQVEEVIFSGGDPLLVKSKRLQHYIESLASIKHLTTIRFHSRIPVVLPERIDDELIAILQQSPLQKVMVIHANHPAELCHQTSNAFKRLADAGVHLLNQSVLLKGVNDNASILAQLNKKLFKQGVLPYYLHLLDKVVGAAHFDVPLADAQQIYKALQNQLPGYLVPNLVREDPAVGHKVRV